MKQIAIIGGGLGGLALAQGLKKNGIHTDVFERTVGQLARRFSPPSLILTGLAVCATATFVPVVGHFSPTVIIVAVSAIGLGSSLINAPLRAALVDRTPSGERATTIAAALTLVTVASPGGALIAATLLALNNAPTTRAITAIAALIPLGFSAWRLRTR